MCGIFQVDNKFYQIYYLVLAIILEQNAVNSQLFDVLRENDSILHQVTSVSKTKNTKFKTK